MYDNNDINLAFSIITPVWPDDPRPFDLDYVDKIDFPMDQVEVLLARGLNPCRQRNKAAEQAKGDVLVFFDDDSCPQPDFLKQLAPHFLDTQVVAAGGPNPAEIIKGVRHLFSLTNCLFVI